MDDEFTATAYPKVQENLKLPTEGEVRFEEPASSAGTLSSMKNLDKDLRFTDQFLVEKSQEDEPEKSNIEAKVQSMVTVPILQDTSSVPLMTTPVIDITDPQSDSTTVPASMTTTTATVTETTTTTTVPPPPPQPQQDILTSILIQTIGQLKQNIADLEIDRKIEESLKEVVTASVQHATRSPLRARFKDLPTSDMKEILLQRMLEENYDKGHEDHKMAYEALQKSIIRDESKKFDADKAEERTKKKSKQDSPKTPPGLPPSPPPPPPPSGASGASDTTRASDSAQDPPPPPPSAPGSSKTIASTEYTAWTMTTSKLKPAASSVPKDVLMREEFVPPPENSLLSQTSDIGVFINWFCKKQGITELTPEHLEGPTYEVVKAFHPDMIHLQFQMEECHKLLTNQVDEGLLRYNVSRPLPLGGPPGQVTIQTEFFFNKDLEYLRFGHKGDRLALSITKIKAASYPDARLDHMVPDQMWAEEEYMYDISASYGISHWWFKRQQFYIDRHSADTNRRAIVRTHMRILSVVRIEVFSLYGLPEPPTAQRQEDSLYYRQLIDKEFGYQKTGLEFMHDYKILDSPRAVVFRDKYGMQMIMRFNEIHKFSDGTLQQIDEALDYRVKEFKVNKVNPGLNTRRSDKKEQASMVILMLYIDDPILILEILSRRFHLKMNLLSQSVLTDPEDQVNDGDGDTRDDDPINAQRSTKRRNKAQNH
ncbi:hypothetical protein Tco_0898674 [Tanacetum coccineum]